MLGTRRRRTDRDARPRSDGLGRACSLRVALEAEGTAYVDGATDQIVATADLSTVASWLGPEVARFGIPPDPGAATTTITVSLREDGSIQSWSFSLGDLALAMKAAGFEGAPRFPRDEFDLIVYSVDLTDPGEPVDIPPPPERLVLDVAPAGAGAALDTCVQP